MRPLNALIVNGSPRKGWNTHQLLKKVEEGMLEARAEVEFVDLYDLVYSGCRSCFSCKRKGNELGGACAYPDDLKPVIDYLMMADAVVLGSPVYLNNVSAQMNMLWERLMYACISYNSYRPVRVPGPKRCAMVITMDCPEELMGSMGYRQKFDRMGQQLGYTLGDRPAAMLYCCGTYQFSDYGKYDISPDRADPARRAAHHARQFPVDLRHAYELGKALCR